MRSTASRRWKTSARLQEEIAALGGERPNRALAEHGLDDERARAIMNDVIDHTSRGRVVRRRRWAAAAIALCLVVAAAAIVVLRRDDAVGRLDGPPRDGGVLAYAAPGDGGGR